MCKKKKNEITASAEDFLVHSLRDKEKEKSINLIFGIKWSC